jgi:uncharacterized 2Fe-2S/4Fe-4S cluster protein (DUF4445 family)
MADNDTAQRFRLTIEGNGRNVACRGDQTLLKALTDAGVFLEASCGGRGSCGKCRLQVMGGPTADRGGSPANGPAGEVCLACQTYPRGDVTIRLATAAASVKGEVAGELADDGQPLLCKQVVFPGYPTLDDSHTLQAMLARSLPSHTEGLADAEIMRQLALAAGGRPEKLTLTLVGGNVTAIETGDTSDRLYGVAFDIGTTTVVGILVDAGRRKVVATATRTNPQAAFGADVISRIAAAAAPDGLVAQAEMIRECLDDIIGELCAVSGVGRENIYAATVAGNSTMAHLLLAVPPASLAVPPYSAVFRHMDPFPAAAIDLAINPGGRVILLPNIASFVGADTAAAVLATGQDESVGPALLIDLGTNGEMVLGGADRLLACSTACGPAFEGACIRDGMRAAPGAIDDVVIDGEGSVTLRTIGGGKPAGLCGSGIVKAVAELLRKRLINASGRFAAGDDLPAGLAGRLRQRDGQWEFILVEGADSAGGADIAVTQSDIRQIQLVKSAICSGIELLMADSGPAEGLPVYLAGAFGNYLDTASALALGLLPGFKPEQVRPVGNAAGIGAVQTLLSAAKLARCRRIAERTEYLELAAHPDFQKKFLENLAFPEVF